MTRQIRAALLAALLATVHAPAAAEDLSGAAAGDAVEFQGQSWTVAGTGTEAFEHTAGGDSYAVVIDHATPVAVIVPPAGALIRIDPAVPMLWVDGAPHAAFESAYMRRNGKGHPFTLLELVR